MRVQGQRWSGARWVGPLAGDRGHLAKETWMEQFEGNSALFGFGFVQPPSISSLNLFHIITRPSQLKL